MDFGADLSFGAILGLAVDFLGAAAFGSFLGKVRSVGSVVPPNTPLRKAFKSLGVNEVETSLRRGWECTLALDRRASSRTRVTSLSALFIMDKGPTHPFLHPSFSSKIFSSAKRKLTFP